MLGSCGLREVDQQFKANFPALADVDRKKTSEVDPRYNCIAWAFGDNTRHWWPNSRFSFWPVRTTGLSDLAAFEAAFALGGWLQCSSQTVELGFEKIALYGHGDKPTHAARLLLGGFWTSKLGANIDLSHDLGELCGPAYGAVMRIYRKKLGTTT